MASNNCEDWRRNKSIGERNKYMLEHELETDVVFKVSSPHELSEAETIRAHKYMLISASPVFWAMLCGQLQEDGVITVPDVAPDAFREMLRFIYAEEARITGNNVMQIFHAAKKYQLSDLVQQCVDFLDQELNASTACSILDHGQFFDEKQLMSSCLEKIEEHTSEALNSEDFMGISADTLGVILDRNKLSLEEEEIFDRCYEWAKNKNDRTKSIRDVLGKNLFKIRFPIMSAMDFTENVCSKDILSEREQLQILKYIASPQTCPKPTSFCCEPRKLGQLEMVAEPADDIMVGDRVRVKEEKEVCFGISVHIGEEGTVQSLIETSLQVKLDRGLLIVMDTSVLEKL